MDHRIFATNTGEASAAGDALVDQLIVGAETEEIVVYDVSDCQLYGRKLRRQLSGSLARRAEVAGCLPEVYQSVYWLTFVGLPVKPLGTFLVLPRQICDDPDGDADQYRALRIPMDWRQIACHYAVAVSLVVCAVDVAVIWWMTRAG